MAEQEERFFPGDIVSHKAKVSVGTITRVNWLPDSDGMSLKAPQVTPLR